METIFERHAKKISAVLVPTDFSDESFHALRYAAALARKLSAKLHVVHVGEIDLAPPGPALPGTNPLTSDTEEARALQQRLGAVIGPSLPVTFLDRTGRAFDQIVRLARELQVDLIVMSTHGRTGLKRLFLGSNAERVVQHSSTPVLVVRRDEDQVIDSAEPLRIQTILVPTDFSAASIEGLNYAINFAREFGARLILFHAFSIEEFVTPNAYGLYNVRPTPEKARSAAEDLMREFVRAVEFGGVDFEIQITMGRAAEEICNYAEEKKIDLIIASTHGRTGFMHVLIGSVAERVVRHARSPVLVVPGSVKKTSAAERAG